MYQKRSLKKIYLIQSDHAVIIRLHPIIITQQEMKQRNMQKALRSILKEAMKAGTSVSIGVN